MHISSRRGIVVVLMCAAAFAAEQPADIPAVLKLIATIPLEGVTGRIGPMEADTHHGRLFVAIGDENVIKIIDVRKSALAGEIANLSEPRQMAYVERENRLFVTNEGDGTLRIFDAEKWKQINSVKLGIDAGAIDYDAPRNRLFVSYGENEMALFDTNGKKLAQLDVKGHVVSFRVHAETGQVYAALPETNMVAVINSELSAVLQTWPVKYAADNRTLAIDEDHKRVFVGCRRPPRILVTDLETGNVTARIPTVTDPTGLFYDAIHGRLYASGGAGRLAIYAQKSADQYEEIGYLPTTPGSRYSHFVPDWNLYFVAEPAFGKHPAAIRVYKPKE